MRLRWRWVPTLLVLLVFSSSNLAFAVTRYLLIDPGSDANSNYYAYYNDIRLSEGVLKKLGRSATILAKDGKWRITNNSWGKFLDAKTSGFKTLTPTTPGIDGPATVASLNSTLASLGAQSEEGDNLVIFITDHGSYPSKPSDPGTAQICMWNENMTFNTLGQMIKKHIPEKTQVAIATTTCFGGGVHQISNQLPNVCSVGATNYFSISYAGTVHNNVFAAAFFNRLHPRIGTSFEQASYAGLAAQQPHNYQQGRLSSADYVEFVLKEGPYRKTYSSNASKFNPGGHSTTVRYREAPQSENSSASAEILKSIDGRFNHSGVLGGVCGTSERCYQCNPQTPQEMLEKDLTSLERIVEFARLSTTGSDGKTEGKSGVPTNSLLEGMRTALKDLKKNKALYLKLIEDYLAHRIKLVKEWEDFEKHHAELTELETKKWETDEKPKLVEALKKEEEEILKDTRKGLLGFELSAEKWEVLDKSRRQSATDFKTNIVESFEKPVRMQPTPRPNSLHGVPPGFESPDVDFFGDFSSDSYYVENPVPAKARKEFEKAYSETQSKMAQLRQKLEQDLTPLFANLATLGEFEDLEQFSKVATSEQMQKYIQLRRCEGLTL